jgi:predicted DNA binding CopG/RHH family protein
LPRDWAECRDEKEEAAWWDANSGRIFDEAVRKGTLKITTLEHMVREAKRQMRPERQPMQQLTLRLPVDVIRAAQAQAGRKGVPYQTLMRSILTEGLKAHAGSPLVAKFRALEKRAPERFIVSDAARPIHYGKKGKTIALKVDPAGEEKVRNRSHTERNETASRA